MSRPAEERLILYEGYGDNWKKLREDKGLTVRDLAKETGISASTICSIENEIRQPTIHHINIYLKYFDVSIDYLTGRSKVKSVEYQEVCAFMGLSEEAINNIKDIGKHYDFKMLEDRAFIEIMIETYNALDRYYIPQRDDDKNA
jgi:transcriptional regulator with XRE-family HTH domain